MQIASSVSSPMGGQSIQPSGRTFAPLLTLKSSKRFRIAFGPSYSLFQCHKLIVSIRLAAKM